MFLIAIIDMIELPFNSVISGIQCATACWYSGCMTCIFLAFNRLFELCFPKFAEKLYGGWRIYVWLAIPVLELIWCALFEKPALYSIKLHAWFFNPFELVEDLRYPTPLTSHFHIFHNSLTMILMSGSYFALIVFMYVKYRFYQAETVSNLQKLMTIQAVLVCFEMCVAAGICILMQHVRLPTILAVIAHVGWIMVN
uniref:Uncharacterized protein n=1 Tax=Acrobeloides nanus TaxID=290746 RepID=A0A914C6S6_9BILA